MHQFRNEEGVPGCCINDIGEGTDRKNFQSGHGLPETQLRCNGQTDSKKTMK